MAPPNVGANASYYNVQGHSPLQPGVAGFAQPHAYPPTTVLAQNQHFGPQGHGHDAHGFAMPSYPMPSYAAPQHQGLTPPPGGAFAQPAFYQAPARPNFAPPAYTPALVQSSDFTKVLETTRGQINAHLDKHPMQKHAGRVVTAVGTLAAIGGGTAVGVAVLAGTFGTLSGIGIPVAAAAALGGVGVGLAGIGVAAFAGAATRAMARRSVAKDPVLREKIEVLQQMQASLLATPKLSKAEKQLLKDVNVVLGKVGGFKAHLKSQVKVAGKTAALASLGVFFVALAAAATENANGGGFFYYFGGGPSLGGGSAHGDPLGGNDGAVGVDAGLAGQWQQVLGR